MSSARRTVVTGVALALVVLAGCSVAGPDKAAPEGTRPGPASGSPASAPVPQRLRFTATTVTGDEFDAPGLAGRDAVLWFWAPWCSDCRREAPYVAAAQARAGDSVTFVGVAGLGPLEDMRAFITDYRVGAFEHIADLDGKVWQRFGVVAQPAFAFIDDDGTIEVVRSDLSAADLAERVGVLTAN